MQTSKIIAKVGSNHKGDMNKIGINCLLKREWNIYLIVAILSSISSVSYAKPSKMDSIEVKLNAIEQRMAIEEQAMACVEREVALYEKEMNAVNEHVDRVNEAIANQIASSSHTIQVWGIVIAVIAIVVSIVLTIAGVVFTYYINKMRKNIVQLTSEAKKQLKQAEAASEDIAEQQQRVNAQQQEIKKLQDATEKNVKELQQLHSDIQNNMNAIYIKLRREETVAMLQRLEEIPEDITNLGDILLARTLEKEDFLRILNAYRNLVKRCSELNSDCSVAELRQKDEAFEAREMSYALQFAQHFFDQAIVVPEVRELLQPRFDIFWGGCFFKNDAEKSTRDFKQGVSSLGEALQTELLSDYINAMSQSPYAMFAEWYKLLLANLSEQQVNDIWDNVTKRNKDAISFAESMKENMMALNPKSALLENIEAYIKKVKEEKGKEESAKVKEV